MKKSLIILLAFGSLAMGDTLVNIMQKGSGNNATTEIWGKKELSLTLDDVAAKVEIGDPAVSPKQDKNTEYENSFFAVNGTNVGNGGTFTYTLTFTAVFDEGVSSVDLGAITLDIFSLNASGNTQNTDKKMQYTYSFATTGKEGDPLKSGSCSELTLAGGGVWGGIRCQWWYRGLLGECGERVRIVAIRKRDR